MQGLTPGGALWMWLTLWALLACGSEIESSRGPLPDDEVPEELSSITPIGGFLDGQRTELYALGEVSVRSNRDGEPADVVVHPLYVFAPDGDPRFATAEDASAPRAIIDVIPEHDDYSGFWEVHRVEASGAGDDIKSRATLLREKHAIEATGDVVNCPVIPRNNSIEPPDLGADVARPVIELWYRRFETRCLLLDGGEALVEGGAPSFSVASVPVGERVFLSVPIHEVFVPRLSLFGDAVDVPGNLISVAEPGSDSPYSPVVRVFDVRVPPDYDFCAFDRLGDVDASLIEVRDPLTFWNLSLLGVAADDSCSE